MLKILRFLVAPSVAFVSSFLFFPTSGITQEYAGCFMVNSLGRMVDLNNICVNETNKNSVYQNTQLRPVNTGGGTDGLNNKPIVRPDGNIIRPDKPNNSNGKSVSPDGTITYSNRIQARPDGTVIYSDGTQARPDGTIFYPDGRQIGPDD